MSYNSRFNTSTPSRDLAVETPIGVLGVGRHNVIIESLSCSAQSIDLNVVDQWDNRGTFRLFILAHDDANTLSSLCKFLIIATSADHNELMALTTGLLEGDFSVVDTLVGRPLMIFVSHDGEDFTLARITKPTRRFSF